MASRGISTGLLMVLVTTFWSRAVAQSQSGCTSVIISLAPCLDYVTGSSTTPTASCCSQLASVVQSQPRCLCEVINGSASSTIGVTLNQTLALALPAACKVQTPPVSECNAANIPSMSPHHSPVGSPQGLPGDSSNTPSVSLTSTTGGSKTFPAPTGSASNHLDINMALQLIPFVLFMIWCASAYISF